MGNVEKLVKNQDIYKIEGEAFERVRVATRVIDKKTAEWDKQLEKLIQESREVKKAFWGVVYEEIGVNLEGANYGFVHKYEKTGLYIVEKVDHSEPDLMDLFGKMQEE